MKTLIITLSNSEYQAEDIDTAEEQYQQRNKEDK